MSTETRPSAPRERSEVRFTNEQTFGDFTVSGGEFRRRLRRIGKTCLRPTVLLVALLIAHLCSRLMLHRTSPSSAAHNYERTYAVSLSLLAGRGFHDLAIDDSAASAPLRDFFGMRSLQISRADFDAYLASKPDPAGDPWVGRYMPLASTRVLDVRMAAFLWRIFGIDRRVLTTFYSLLSVATCGCLFFIARRLTNSDWAGLAAAALLTFSPIEGFLNTWSWRDSSPMWFTAASFAWFISVMDRPRRQAVNLAACLALGVLTTLGIGWRPDALMLAPFLAMCMTIRLIANRAGWRHLLAAASCFLLGAFSAHAAITSLGPEEEEAQTANIGYHMAFYSDFRRSQLLGIENSFQVLFDDMQTLDDARQIYRADHPDSEPLQYLTPEYCDICRTMFFEQLNYNLYRWVSRFPRFYFQSLAGLDRDSVIGEPGSRRIRSGLRSPLRQTFRLGDRLGHAMPFLFLLGVLATTCTGRQRLPALLLALFSVYYTGIMFIVLPDQKHIGVLLVPLYAFAGAGVWGIVRLFVRSAWRGESRAAWYAGFRRAITLTAIVTTAWGLSCALAYCHSVSRREQLLSDIQKRAASGIDAPETLRGGRNFAVSFRPDSPGEACGYLLTIAASDHPGTLVCRQLYFPHDWAQMWGRELTTRHTLVSNRTQSFFVSCVRCARLGDPRPQLCAVAIDGAARITDSTRVAMTDWDHPQISTLFYEGQNSPGSPAVDQSPTDRVFPNGRAFADGSPDKLQANRDGMTDRLLATAAPPPAGRPLRHLIARSTDTGLWKIAMSDGWRFSFADLNFWSPATKWLQLQSGDFNGDGMFDLISQAPDGQWWVATANGGYHEFRSIDSLPRDARYDFVGVGDFNGDGLDDLILRSTDGHWTVAFSTGDGFRCQSIDGLPHGATPQHILIGDFLGNGRSQVAGLVSKSGRWTIARLEGKQWVSRTWGDFSPGVDWQHLTVGDFCGSGHADIAAWNPATGDWIVGHDAGAGLVAKPFGTWPARKTWKCIQVGQFGDGRYAGLAAVDSATDEVNIAVSDGQRFTTRQYPGHAALADQFFVGPFSGGPRDELVGIATDGQLWVGKFQPDGELRFESWGRWPDADRLTDFRAVGFWPEHRPSR
jgi:hypothetical protein